MNIDLFDILYFLYNSENIALINWNKRNEEFGIYIIFELMTSHHGQVQSSTKTFPISYRGVREINSHNIWDVLGDKRFDVLLIPSFHATSCIQ